MYTGPNAITNGLVLSLDAANQKSYPGSGTTWRDLSGNNNNGTLNNTFTFNADKGGNLLFTAANSNTVTGPLSQGLGTDVTVEIVLKIDTSNNPVLYGLATNNNSQGLGIFVSTGIWSWNTGDSNSNAFTANPTITTTSYNHIVVTNAAASNAKLYVNSILIGTAGYRDATTTGAGNKYEIGAFWQNKSNFLFYINANCPLFKIYNRALTAAEVDQNFNATKTRFGL